MVSPILLGNTPILRHGLGAAGYNVNAPGGGWGGTYGVGYVQLFINTVTISHPDGSNLYGRACFDCYTAVPGSVIEGCIQIDGGGLVGFGRFYFINPNGAAAFEQFCFTWNSAAYGRLAAGNHTVSVGVYVEAGQVTFDTDCGGVALVEEVPS